MIDAFHSNWTKPFFVNNNKDYFIEDFEILTTILSALKWQENNGDIKMITDSIGKKYYEFLGINDLWNLGIDTSLDNIDKRIDPKIFWAAGKLFALKNTKSPIVMMDTDFIVWKPLNYMIKNKELCIVHREGISPEVYPNKDYFTFNNNYTFNPKWDWNEEPCNTCFTYINNDIFKEYYINSAIDFMSNRCKDNDQIKNMVFAEQRLISMCAKEKNIKISSLTTLMELAKKEQSYFTHTWGFKEVMRRDYEIRYNFCVKCIQRILKDFPHYRDKLYNIIELRKYFK